MFNWNPSTPPRDEWRDLMEERLIKCETEHAAKYNDLKVTFERDRADLWKAVKDAMEAANKPAPPVDLTALKSRMDDLELWRGKMHTLLTEKSMNTGKEKLSKIGHAASKFYSR